jgi:hypothetical protein
MTKTNTELRKRPSKLIDISEDLEKISEVGGEEELEQSFEFEHNPDDR